MTLPTMGKRVDDEPGGSIWQDGVWEFLLYAISAVHAKEEGDESDRR